MISKRLFFIPSVLLVWACAQNSGGPLNDGGAGGEGGGAEGGVGATAGASMGGGFVGGMGGSAGIGGSALTGGSAGTGGRAQGPVVPVAMSSAYRFAFDGFAFVVDAKLGGRVTEFSLNAKNVLSGPDANADNYGSTFWPSPQSAWNWPPPAEIDTGEYAARVEGGTLILESKPSGGVNLAITKRIAVDRAAQAVVITYEMKNTGAVVATWAPWEITRVAPGGLTFFALGAGGTAAVGTWVPTPLQDANMWRWFDDAVLQIADNKGRKTFADGKGWIAHVARNQRLLLIKSFEDVAQNAQAKDEAELEIFVDGARKYVEVENQGAAMAIPAGGTRVWAVRWALRALATDASLDVGSPALVSATKTELAAALQ